MLKAEIWSDDVVERDVQGIPLGLAALPGLVEYKQQVGWGEVFIIIIICTSLN
jgi:hypothetical protein